MKEQQEKYNLPESWIWTTLENICYKITDGSHNPPPKQDKGIPMLSARNIENYAINFDKDVRYINEDAYKNEVQRTNIQKGDILLTIVGTIGRVTVVEQTTKFAIQRSVALLNPIIIYSKYLMYYISSPFCQKILIDNATGTAQKGIYLTTLKRITIPLPPIQEQEKIVLKLEEILSGLEKSKEQLELSFNKLIFHKKTFFKSLLERKKPSVNFVEKRFEDCVVSYSSKRIPLSRSVRKERSGHYRYYGATGVIDYIDDYIFDGKYLLLGEDGANLLSKVKDLSFIVEGKFWVNNHAHIVQAKENIHLEYLNYYFNSLVITEYVTGTAQPKLNQANLNRIPILIPSPDEQISIVQEMQRVLSIIEKTENVITKELTRIDLFKQTILNKSFTGKLLNQDYNDEPASILLERIKAEKEEYLIREKEKKNNSIKIKIMPEESKSILEILRESIEPVSSKKLWLSSDKKDDIEEFYAELKKHIESGDIIELPRNGKESFLKLADKS